jgi:hypothetical protein
VSKAATVVLICDACLDHGDPDIRAASVDLAIGDTAGTLDLCQHHREPVNYLRSLLVKHARPLPNENHHNAPAGVPPAGEEPGSGSTGRNQPQVRCGLCGRSIALRARGSHARHAHRLTASQIHWEGSEADLPYPCPAPDCRYRAASRKGRGQHIRHQHPDLKNASNTGKTSKPDSAT